MEKLLALAGAAVLMSACAGPVHPDPVELNSGYIAPNPAAFMGYHGPLHRENKATD